MKNATIYKDLKIKSNRLTYNGLDIFIFQEGSMLTEHIINQTVFDLKRFLDKSMKNALKQAYEWELFIDGNITSLRLHCMEEDGYKYKRKIDFLSFFPNQITYI